MTAQKVNNISKLPFWDVNFEKIDFEKDKTFVIAKAMNYGGMNDFKATLSFYGKDIVKQEIVKATDLSKEVLNFMCFYFKLKKEDFVCYNRRQSVHQLWDY
jgi:hypothetical protein